MNVFSQKFKGFLLLFAIVLVAISGFLGGLFFTSLGPRQHPPTTYTVTSNNVVSIVKTVIEYQTVTSYQQNYATQTLLETLTQYPPPLCPEIRASTPIESRDWYTVSEFYSNLKLPYLKPHAPFKIRGWIYADAEGVWMCERDYTILLNGNLPYSLYNRLIEVEGEIVSPYYQDLPLIVYVNTWRNLDYFSVTTTTVTTISTTSATTTEMTTLMTTITTYFSDEV